VSYTVTNQWPGGFGATISITNTGSTAWNGWTLKFTFPGSQQVTQLWNGSVTQSGSSVTVTNASYNGQVAAGAAVSPGPGFNGSWTGSNPNPTSFTLNGATCTTS
jgi:Cellulose binding domain